MKPWIRNSLLCVAVGGCVWGTVGWLGERTPDSDQVNTKQQELRAEASPEAEKPAHSSAAPLSSSFEGSAPVAPSFESGSAGLSLETELSELRHFWTRSADAGAPLEAINDLEAFARAHQDDERLAGAALDMREDLIAVRARKNGWLDPREEPDAGWNPETGEGAPPERDEDWVPADWIAMERYELMTETVRYGADTNEILSAVHELSRFREDMVSQTLLEAVDHPSADIRKTATEALWRSAAEGIEVEATQERLYYLARDSNERVARLAEVALADLDRLEEEARQTPTVSVSAEEAFEYDEADH